MSSSVVLVMDFWNCLFMLLVLCFIASIMFLPTKQMSLGVDA